MACVVRAIVASLWPSPPRSDHGGIGYYRQEHALTEKAALLPAFRRLAC